MKTLKDIIQEKLIINKNIKIRSKNKENWSIKTAEDGDFVKVDKYNLIFIYKCVDTKGQYSKSKNSIIYHAIYHYGPYYPHVKIGPKIGVGSPDSDYDFKLATDEEKQEFIKHLKIRGYEWDNIKKEIVEL